jgi:hypothetical protein
MKKQKVCFEHLPYRCRRVVHDVRRRSSSVSLERTESSCRNGVPGTEVRTRVPVANPKQNKRK